MEGQLETVNLHSEHTSKQKNSFKDEASLHDFFLNPIEIFNEFLDKITELYHISKEVDERLEDPKLNDLIKQFEKAYIIKAWKIFK